MENMENMEITRSQDFIHYHNVDSLYLKAGIQVDMVGNRELYDKLDAEGCKSFFHYLNWLGLAKNPNLIVLTPSHHYYYEAEDLKETKILVNLKQLNDIRQLMDFFYTIFRILPLGSYFIGCFLDKKDQHGSLQDSHKLLPKTEERVSLNKNRNDSRVTFLNRIFSKIDFGTKRHLNNGIVTILLEEALLKVLDMTKLNGLTLFCAQKIQSINMYD
jgi:hypothetical protein